MKLLLDTHTVLRMSVYCHANEHPTLPLQDIFRFHKEPNDVTNHSD